MPKQVFIIYGRDIEAHDELVKFIRSLGLKELPFESVADELGPNPFVADIVLEGIKQADAVIALFTPDEQAALFSSETAAAQRSDETRWQARPNVIFEAGVALGIARDKTILVTLGGDIRLFSDLSGMHFIDLSSANAKQRLRTRLSRINGIGEFRSKRNWMEPSVSGDFRACFKKRWDYYDELQELETELRNTAVYGTKRSLFDVLEGIALMNPGASWEDWTSEDLMRAIFERYDRKKGETANSAYYYLIITGFLAFKDIQPWWQPRCQEDSQCIDYWMNSVEFSKLTSRGARLLYKIQRVRL